MEQQEQPQVIIGKEIRQLFGNSKWLLATYQAAIRLFLATNNPQFTCEALVEKEGSRIYQEAGTHAKDPKRSLVSQLKVLTKDLKLLKPGEEPNTFLLRLDVAGITRGDQTAEIGPMTAHEHSAWEAVVLQAIRNLAAKKQSPHFVLGDFSAEEIDGMAQEAGSKARLKKAAVGRVVIRLVKKGALLKVEHGKYQLP